MDIYTDYGIFVTSDQNKEKQIKDIVFDVCRKMIVDIETDYDDEAVLIALASLELFSKIMIEGIIKEVGIEKILESIDGSMLR